MKKTTKIMAVAMILSASASCGAFAKVNNKNNNDKSRPCIERNQKMQKNKKNPDRNPPAMMGNRETESIRGIVDIEGNKDNPLIKLTAKDGNVYAVKVIGDKSELLSMKGKNVELTGFVDKDSNIIAVKAPQKPTIILAVDAK